MLRLKQCANFSGESEAVWKKRVRLGEIPIARLGRNVRILESDLLQYIADRTARVRSVNVGLPRKRITSKT